MPIQIPTFLVPRNANTFYLLDDKYLRGGFQVRADHNDRNSIPVGNRKAGMLVYTQNDQKLWSLTPDLSTWEAASLGGSGAGLGERSTQTYVIPELQPNGFHDFQIEAGKTIIVHKLGISIPMMVQAYSKPTRNDENPFTFLATSDHLLDDGTTLMSDGSVMKNRRYSILSNEEDPAVPIIYFRVTNTEQIASGATLTITYVALE